MQPPLCVHYARLARARAHTFARSLTHAHTVSTRSAHARSLTHAHNLATTKQIKKMTNAELGEVAPVGDERGINWRLVASANGGNGLGWSPQAPSKGRTPKDCEIQWAHKVHPWISKTPWSKQEDLEIIKFTKIDGTSCLALPYRACPGGPQCAGAARLAGAHGIPSPPPAHHALRRHGRQAFWLHRPTLNQETNPPAHTGYACACVCACACFVCVCVCVIRLGAGPYSDWTALAKKLHTHTSKGRTPVQVFRRYQQSVNPDQIATKWSKEDDAVLLKYVEQHGVGNWAKIALEFQNNGFRPRTREQCLDRHHYSLVPHKKGKWSQEENEQLQQGVAKYGAPNWCQVAEMVSAYE